MSWDDLKGGLFAQWKPWWISRHPKDIGEYSWAYLFERGKQIRPRLFCELWRYLCPERQPSAELAFIIECVHVASLILDDLPWMDNAKERRGWKTLHCMYSTRKALLLTYDVLELAQEVSKTSTFPLESATWDKWVREKLDALWRGQFLDLSRKGSLEELATLKTGTLFECVTELVAISIDLDSIFWRSWGQALGVLFQWVDDWNDKEEDKIIQQRNAFNESYEDTMMRYRILWTQVVQGVGSGWWETPFGQYLWNYFTSISVNTSVIPLTSAQTLVTLFSTPVSSCISTPLVSSEEPALLFMTTIRPYLFLPIPTTSSMSFLWNIEEEQWLDVLEKSENARLFRPFFRFL